jgi:5-dehydro-2-deoxygluconokinase
LKSLDVITIGRSSVDLYGQQVGGRLEDMASFQKYIGGSPTNTATGAARLGLKSAVITRVGDEHMGRFIREELAREGVDTRSVITDPIRLTALVLLGIRDQEQFPLIFYRTDCADMALCEADIDPKIIAQSRAVVASGTHLSHPRTAAATLKALHLACEFGSRTALDIDYRPNLWGLAGHSDGDSRFIESQAVTTKLQSTLHLFDLIVGTEEEFHIAGGSTDTITALKGVRALSSATLVCKRGPMGASAFEGEIPTNLNHGISGTGFPIEVFNVLGAGDGFMAGLLKGWLDNEGWHTSLSYANACGALAVSRHGCTPAYPSWQELQFFLKRGIKIPALRKDTELEQIHWSTNRKRNWPDLRVFAFDHYHQFESSNDATPEKISTFKSFCLEAALKVAKGRAGYGILCDSQLGQDTLYRATGQDLWIGRPTQQFNASLPKLEQDLGRDIGELSEWPLDNVVKVLVQYHPTGSAELRAEQLATISRLFHASRRNRLEFLLELNAASLGAINDKTTAQIIQQVYKIGVFPDWWHLEPLPSDDAWNVTCAAITRNDANTRGILIQSENTEIADLTDAFTIAARHPLVKGFAAGRTVFAQTSKAFLQGAITPEHAVADMAAKFETLCAVWEQSRALAQEQVSRTAQ